MKTWCRQGEDLLYEMENTRLAIDEIALWYLGQCGFLVQKGDYKILIDPVLTDLKDAQGNTRRLYPAPFDPALLEVDTVLCTHAHRDHMCIETLQKLKQANPDLFVIVPKGEAEYLASLGMDRNSILGLNEKEIARNHGIRIQTIQTAHPVHRKNEKEQDLNLAYYIDMSGHRLLHLGDTYLTEKLVEDLMELEGVDVFMTPINGSDYFRTIRGCIGNLDGYESAKLASMLGANLTIPTHYDMMTGNTCSPIGFVQSMMELCPGGRMALPVLGERLILKKERTVSDED